MCSDDVPTIAALVDRSDDKLFKSILHDAHHILNNLMPEDTCTVCTYELRHRHHNREFINTTSRIADSDFVIRIKTCKCLYLFYVSHYVTLRSDKV